MSMKHRLWGFAALAAVLAVTQPPGSAVRAAAPQQKTQAPGYYRFMLGDVEITALSDGTFQMDPGGMLHITPQQLEPALTRAYLKSPVETSVNGFLVNTGSKLVLIDTGAGTLFGPTLGRLLGNLEASGYRAEQVDEIYITHMHGDHVGGLLADGKPAYPNAVVRAARQEADFWLSKPHMDAAPKDRKESYQVAMNMLNPYIAAGKFKPFDGDIELVPGIRARAAHGHTAGHAVYVVESKGQKLVLWGDLMHVASVQFPDPTVTISFDTDSDMAAAQRKRIFADAAEQGLWVAGAHLSFPGIGHLRAMGPEYLFVPANYSALH